MKLLCMVGLHRYYVVWARLRFDRIEEVHERCRTCNCPRWTTSHA